ncbi:Metallo-hydrolase/oxidoreductase [Byssothecium circinans]|uniref:Metallo-hydrolase/oxidoreductase n=1 Tax=Byssothecium circinans TaxID=147558 RepID=A0A6A5TDW2_9PLEO|nr:Metallo-hydrolase/oxidoreductase [Byssothecium circinans]
MSSSDPSIVTLPAPQANQTYVTISALEGGHLTLPEKLFVTDADPEKRATVPSLSFLIQHPSPNPSSKPTNLVFDLGLKRDFKGYRTAQQHHIAQRQPTTVSPDVADSLRKGNLEPRQIDTVILSHVHWDHVGTPSDFPNAEFVVGSGTLHLLAHGGGPLYPAELFNADELPLDRTRELPPTSPSASTASPKQTNHVWKPLAGFPAAIDFFTDGSVYIIDAPGHLPGHVNLLARTAPRKWVYLGGDCCHDVRILRGERGIAVYDDGRGGLRSVHADTGTAEKTVRGVARLMREGAVREEGAGGEVVEVEVEVVVAHDGGWREGNRERFWPGRLHSFTSQAVAGEKLSRTLAVTQNQGFLSRNTRYQLFQVFNSALNAQE